METNTSLIEKELYHRSPYILIDDIMESSPKHIQAMKFLSGEEYFFKGHFPHAPVLPGAMMQEMTTQTAGVLIARHHNPLGEDYDTNNFDLDRPALGVLSRIKDARFKGFARPGDNLIIEIDLIENLEDFYEFKGRIYKESKDSLIMSNRFCLTNIPSRHLVGN